MPNCLNRANTRACSRVRGPEHRSEGDGHKKRGINFERQRSLPISYKGVHLDCGYRLDLVVGDRILLELKAVERLLPIHEAQVITYLRLSRLPVGLLVNFNVTVLRNGLRRLTADHPKTFRSSALPVQSE